MSYSASDFTPAQGSTIDFDQSTDFSVYNANDVAYGVQFVIANAAGQQKYALYTRGVDGTHGGGNHDLGYYNPQSRLSFTLKFADYYSGWQVGDKLIFKVTNRDDEVYSVTYNFKTPYTSCGAPTTCSTNKTLSRDNVTLSWSGAMSGQNNAISDYEIQRCESTDGKTWSGWGALTTTTATSATVAPPSTAGHYYKFRVRARGTAGASYYSGWKESTNTLRKDHDPLAGFTDSPLAAGVTQIKALHMAELQNRVNTLRTFYGLAAYGFTTITQGVTSLAGWTAHVAELRAAIDQICSAAGKTHGTWIAFSVNCPRADVIEQLRAVVLAL